MAKKRKIKVDYRTATLQSNDGEIAVYCAFQQMQNPKDLIPHPDNNNDHTDEQVEMMMKMLKVSGWRTNIVVSQKNGLIVAGHLRVRAAIALGLEQVPVDVQYFENRAAEFRHLTADNELAKLSEFNAEKFALTAKELEQEMEVEEFEEFIFDASHFGLEDLPDLDPKEDRDEEEDKVPPAPEKPLTRKGDVWRMHTHKLMCGDSSSPKNISALMGDERATLMFTDPPYRMDAVDGGSSQPVGQAARKLGERIKHLCEFDPVAFLNTFPTALKKGMMNAYIFCNKDLVPDYLNWAIAEGYSFNILFWKKPNAIPLGGSHRPDVEYLLLFRKSATWNNGVPGVSYSKCLEYGRDNSTEHPTMKPVGLIANEIQISSDVGDIIFEPFSGSGSTLIAAEKTNRRCFAMELDEAYTDIAVKRWQEYTGSEAFLEETGETWTEVMARRQEES